MYDLILYDTSDFQAFPIGGQLSSIRNFLRYIACCRPDYARHILLVGITTRREAVGKLDAVELEGIRFAFLPVLYREAALSQVKTSLRLAYAKALLGSGVMTHCSGAAIHYLHTPESYLPVKLLRPGARTAVFSHGNFFHMAEHFRFCRGNRVIAALFRQYVMFLLKGADRVFILDEATRQAYGNHTSRLSRVENSIVLRDDTEDRRACHDPVRVLYVGRLSKVKGLDQILLASSLGRGVFHLTLVGDGEEASDIQAQIEQQGLSDTVFLAGGCAPDRMEAFYRTHDILLLNSRAEGKPLAILEAMSYGLPVVTTPVGGIPELVRQGQEAEFTDGTPEQILGKIAAVQADYPSYSRRARSRAECYDFRAVNHKILKELESLR